MGVHLAGVLLYLLLLPGDVVQALDVLADPLFVGSCIPDLRLRVRERAIVLRDLRFLIGDPLQLATARIAQSSIARCSSTERRASG